MKKRFFAFGCSFTYWHEPTWADFVGANFEEYYNYGHAGISNQLIMNRFIEVDDHFKFNSETDMVIIALTGLGRFNFMFEHNEKDYWVARGDYSSYQPGPTDAPELEEYINFVRNKFWKKNWGAYQSWLAVKTMKNFLVANNIEHKFISALDNHNFISDGSPLKKYDQEVYDILDIKESIHEFNNHSLDHPGFKTYYQFVKKHLPEFLTDRATAFYEKAEQHLKTHKHINEIRNCQNDPNSGSFLPYGRYY